MSNLELIPKYKHDIHEKCKVCAQTKITKAPFSKIDRSFTLLQLVHNDVCDLHSTPTKGGKNILLHS